MAAGPVHPRESYGKPTLPHIYSLAMSLACPALAGMPLVVPGCGLVLGPVLCTCCPSPVLGPAWSTDHRGGCIPRNLHRSPGSPGQVWGAGQSPWGELPSRSFPTCDCDSGALCCPGQGCSSPPQPAPGRSKALSHSVCKGPWGARTVRGPRGCMGSKAEGMADLACPVPEGAQENQHFMGA